MRKSDWVGEKRTYIRLVKHIPHNLCGFRVLVRLVSPHVLCVHKLSRGSAQGFPCIIRYDESALASQPFGEARTVTTSPKVHIVRRNHIGNDRLGTIRTRVVMLLKHLSNSGGRVQDDDRLVEDLEGEDVAEFLGCDNP